MRISEALLNKSNEDNLHNSLVRGLVEALLLNESIVDNLQNSLVRGLVPEHGPGTQNYNTLLRDFKAITNQAKKAFQKQDGKVDNSKVVWALRWYVLDTKIHLIYNKDYGYPTLYTEKEEQRIRKQAEQAGIKIGNEGVRGIFPGGDDQFFYSMNHFIEHDGFGNTIRNMTFKPEETPTAVHMRMANVETEWIKALKDDERSIAHGGVMSDMDTGEETEYREMYEEFIKFPDGSAWFDLDRAFCSKEGESMGHCGNTASYKDDDTILSYRTPHPHKKYHWTPHLTFILDGAGYLGEMKGYANQKPSAKYHNVIRTLIMNKEIKGIKGGGYHPEANFSVWDLPDAAELIAKKPGLAGDNIGKYVEDIGIDDTLVEIITTKLDNESQTPQLFIPRDTAIGKTAKQAMEIPVQITNEYPDVYSLISYELANSTYDQVLRDGETPDLRYRDEDYEPWSIKDWATTLRRDNNKDTGHNELWKYIPEATRNILNTEFATVLGDELEEDVLNNAIKYDEKTEQDYVGIADILVEAVNAGWEEGIRHEVVLQFKSALENSDYNFVNHSGGGLDLAIVFEKPGLPSDSPNRCYITAPIVQIVDWVVREEQQYGEVSKEWWSMQDINFSAEEVLQRSEVVPNAQFEVRAAAEDFQTSMIQTSPILKNRNEKFHISYYTDAQGVDLADNYWKREEEENKVQSESVTPKKVIKLAQVLTGSNSKKGHDKLHKMCSRLGLSADQCHAITSKAGYT